MSALSYGVASGREEAGITGYGWSLDGKPRTRVRADSKIK